MQVLINALVKYIGYPLASMLVEKLIQGVRTIYTEEIIENTEESLVILSEERDVIVKSISRAINNEERKHLSNLLSKLGSK